MHQGRTAGLSKRPRLSVIVRPDWCYDLGSWLQSFLGLNTFNPRLQCLLSEPLQWFLPVFVPPPAEGDRLPCEVFSGVPLCCYHSPEFSLEPAPSHQGGRLWGGPALLCFHLQLHHVSQSISVFPSLHHYFLRLFMRVVLISNITMKVRKPIIASLHMFQIIIPHNEWGVFENTPIESKVLKLAGKYYFLLK